MKKKTGSQAECNLAPFSGVQTRCWAKRKSLDPGFSKSETLGQSLEKVTAYGLLLSFAQFLDVFVILIILHTQLSKDSLILLFGITSGDT